jgi:hypothetical protein
MVIAPLLAPLIGWIFREVVIKFMVLSAVFAIVAVLVPVAISLIGPFVNTATLSNAFAGLPAGIWFFLDFFNLGFGLPLLISAWITRFLIRRLPVIG